MTLFLYVKLIITMTSAYAIVPPLSVALSKGSQMQLEIYQEKQIAN